MDARSVVLSELRGGKPSKKLKKALGTLEGLK